MFVTVVFYGDGEFAARADALERLASCARDAFSWQPFRFVEGVSMTSRRTGNRAFSVERLQKLALGIRSGKLDGIWLAERSDAAELTEPTQTRPAFLSIKVQERSLTGRFDDPPNVLPCTVSLVAEVVPTWPTAAQRQALCDMASVAGAQYGCVFVGEDPMRAESECVLGTVYMMGDPDPPWASEIYRMARYRYQIGDRMRGAYWGNFLPDGMVAAVGGEAAVSAIGATVFARVHPTLTYVQLTPTVEEALTEEGLARMERFRALFAPVMVGM
jgi:hypothetical protein